MLKLLKSFLKVLIGIIVIVVGYIGINEGMAAYAHYKIDKAYFSTPENYIYVMDRENEKEIVETITRNINKFPEGFVKEFKSSWKVVVSPTPPSEIFGNALLQSDKISGLNDSTSKTIWICSNMEGYYDELFAHEFGHYIAYELGGDDYSDEFVELYNAYKDKYIQHGKTKINAYDTSTSNEFFAMLCQEYICHPEYLKKNFQEGYEYIEKRLEENPYSFFARKYINEFVSTFCKIKMQISENLKILKE